MSFVSRVDQFHAAAMQATGLSDFGSADYLEPMRQVLSDYDRYTRFSPLGLQMTEGNLIGLLASRLLTQQQLQLHPHWVDAPLEKPIVIVGTMRSGSTALHRLLAADPDCQWLPPWLGAAPMPRPPRETWAAQPMYEKTTQALEQLYAVAPNFRAMHPMAADWPDECRFAVDHSFWSPGLACLASAPHYVDWCLNGDVRFAYRRHRQILNLIAGGSPLRWVLKDPCHLWGLDALLDVFPGACVVWTHRDPVSAMASSVAIFSEVRGAIETFSREHIGRDELRHWGAALRKAERVRQQHDPARFLDIHASELQADPLEVVQRIYRHFGLPLTERQRDALSRYVQSSPDAGHSSIRHRSEDFGFTRDDVYHAIGDYGARYEQVLEQSDRFAVRHC